MTDFKNKGFVVIKGLVDIETSTKLYEYTLNKMPHGQPDTQVPNSPAFYQDPEVVKLQKRLLPLLEKEIGMQLLPVFCYNRVYRTGAVLRMHKDSTRAEISATINLGQSGTPWELSLLDYDENTHRVSLSPGDALIYHGEQLHHWRGKLIDADLVSQIMFHFVNKNGKHTSSARYELIRKTFKYIRQLRGLAY